MHSACLPRRPAVAYLCLVRRKMLARPLPPAIFVLLGCGALYMSYVTFAGRLEIAVDGTILSRQAFTYYQRPHALYTVTASDGATRTFESGPSDASLPRDLPVGSHVTKRKGAQLYSRRPFSFRFSTRLLQRAGWVR